MQKRYGLFLYGCIFLFLSQMSYSVPTSFITETNGVNNLRDVEWTLFRSDVARVYVPSRSQHLGAEALNAIENAYPFLSLLLGVRIQNDPYTLFPEEKNRTLVSAFEHVVVILGDDVDNVGFANPILDNIEIQTRTSQPDALYEHELVHRLMYEHVDPRIGPIGRIWSLAMMPTWWIEGLAEYLTESVGNAQTDGLERYMALSGDWPTWESLHALYHEVGEENTKGYVTSGRFLGWIFSQVETKDLYEIHQQIAKETWSFPYYNASDAWLSKYLHKTGRALYEEFKAARKKYWSLYLKQIPALPVSPTPVLLADRPLNKARLTDVQKKDLLAAVRKEIGYEIFIRDAYWLKNGNVRALVEWDRILGLIDVTSYADDSQKLTVKPIAAFGEWVQYLFPSTHGDDYVETWFLRDKVYERVQISVSEASAQFALWQKAKGISFAKTPPVKDHTPPYLKIYQSQKQMLLSKDSDAFEKEVGISAQKSERTQQEEKEVEEVEEPAPQGLSRGVASEADAHISRYVRRPSRSGNDGSGPVGQVIDDVPLQSRSGFAYPYPLPEIWGGPSINLIAYPILDEMERYFVQVLGGYQFYLKAPFGGVSYVDRRFLDSISFSIFSNPFFNGMYVQPQYSSAGVYTGSVDYYDYLQQSGASLGFTYSVFGGRLFFDGLFSYSYLQPYAMLNTPPAYIGPQKTNLASASGHVKWKVGDFKLDAPAEFYLNERKGQEVRWKNDVVIGGGKYNGLESSQGIGGEDTGTIDYYNVNGAVSSVFSFYKHTLSLLGNISTTRGPRTFYLQEFYAPYQPYILGSTTVLSSVTYPIISSDALFDILMGSWSYQGSVLYEMNVFPSLESLILMSHVSDFKLLLGLSRGGVAAESPFTGPQLLETTASIGLKTQVDIKGFPFYPSLLYSQLIGKSGWGVVMKLEFMDFLGP